MSELVKEAFYPHPAQCVWAALTNGQAVAQWLMPNNMPAQVTVGTRFEFRVDPIPVIGGLVQCEVLECDAPRRMVWSWTTVKKNGKTLGPQRIEWELIPRDNGTLLRFRQVGIEKLPWIPRKMMAFGWGTMLNRWLPGVLKAFTPDGAGGAWSYHRIEKAPNRGHHRVKTIPAEFYR